MKKLITMCMSIVLACSMLVGCGKSMDINELMTKVQEAQKDTTSFTLGLDVKVDLSVDLSSLGGDDTQEPMTIKVDVGGDCDMIVDPMAMHGNIDMNVDAMNEQQKMNIEMYIVNEKDKIVLYMNDEDGSWMAEEVEASDLGVGSLSEIAGDPQLLLNSEMVEALQLKVNGTKKVDGIDSYVVNGMLTEDALKAIMKAAGEDISALEEEEDDEVTALLKSLEIPFSYYVDTENYRIVRAEVDIQKAFAAFSSILGDAFTMNSATCVVTYANYNEVKDIKVPAKIKKDAVYLEDLYE